MARESFVTCAASEMGFLRVSLSRAFAASFADAIAVLEAIVRLRGHRFVRDGIRAQSLPDCEQQGCHRRAIGESGPGASIEIGDLRRSAPAQTLGARDRGRPDAVITRAPEASWPLKFRGDCAKEPHSD
jgi:hypothetical protein